jgi:hypothetical protein
MVTIEEAKAHDQFEHVAKKNADGTRMRVRRNGRTKLWKTKPERFQIPVKHGLYSYGYITNENAGEWEAT